MNNSLPKLVIVLGPTASGKSELSYRLAMDFGFEIVSADSLLVYKYMNIGTAKPSKEMLARIPHHLIDILEPSEDFNAGKFNFKAGSTIDKLNNSNKKVLMVGGTYLYIKALTEGIIGNIETDKQYRENLKKLRYLHGNSFIYSKLKSVDPISSERINCNDYVRMERALEVYHTSGVKLSELQINHAFSERKFNILKIGLRTDKKTLDENIKSRTSKMLESGLIREVENILHKGYPKNIKPLKSIGYKEAIEYLDGRMDLNKLYEQIVKNTKRLAKKQMTWLKRDTNIKWFDVPYDYNSIKEGIDTFYNDQSCLLTHYHSNRDY